jgi:hypothetical protein
MSPEIAGGPRQLSKEITDADNPLLFIYNMIAGGGLHLTMR